MKPRKHPHLLAAVNRQGKDYREAREANPELFGNHQGAWDNTPLYGPMPLILPDPNDAAAAGWILWGMHKHRWPMSYIYCFGEAKDSRGERTDPLLVIDIRELPAKYIGRFKLTDPGCSRKSHRTIFARALADGYDLAEHAARHEERFRAEAELRRALIAVRQSSSICEDCGISGADTQIVNGRCGECDDIPF